MENIKVIKVFKTIIRQGGISSEVEIGCILAEKDINDELLESLIVEKYGLLSCGGMYYKESSFNEVKISDLSIAEYILLNQAMKGVI